MNSYSEGNTLQLQRRKKHGLILVCGSNVGFLMNTNNDVVWLIKNALVVSVGSVIKSPVSPSSLRTYADMFFGSH